MWRRPSKASVIPHPSKACKAVALSFIAAVVISATIVGKNRTNPTSQLASSVLKGDTFRPSVELHPFVARRNGTSVIWQLPSSSPPKAALFLAHGCNGKAENFWDRSALCAACVGLPEERRIVLQALDRGFTVVAVSSQGRCWSLRKEVEIVKGIIQWWFNETKLQKLPLVAMGASSGGYFVSALAASGLKFSSVAIMIAEGVFDEMGVPAGYPPTLFVHMPKDRARAVMVKRNMEALRHSGVDVKEIRCMEFPLTPGFLSDRVPGVDPELSESLLKILRDKGFMNDKGYMTADGRAIPWKRGVKSGKYAPRVDELGNHIQEELNLAFAYHEMTSLQMEEILGWFESHFN